MSKPKNATPCGYCFENWAEELDHILPKSRGGSNAPENLYPSCKRCNRFLRDKEFESLDEKRNYIREELIERGEWHSADEMQRMRESLSSKKKMAGVLFSEMSIRKLGQGAPKNPKVILREVDGMREIEIQGLGKTMIPEDWDDEKVKENIAALCARFKKSQPATSGPRVPQARIPHRIEEVKGTTNGKGLEVVLDTGHRMFSFDNHKMDEKGTRLHDILRASVGKMMICTTKMEKNWMHIDRVFQIGEREWDDEGVPVLRREPASKMREPGEEG